MELITELLALVKSFATMDTPAKAAGVLMLLLSAWKSSVLAPYWAKLGTWKVLVAPVLGLAIAMVQLPEISLATVWQGLQGGLLAVAFHQVLQAVKALPLIGEKYKMWVELCERILLKPKDAA